MTGPFESDAAVGRRNYGDEVSALKIRSARVLERIRAEEVVEEEKKPPGALDDDGVQRYEELMTAVMDLRRKNRQMKAQIRDLQAKLVESRVDEQKVAEFVESSYQQRLHFKAVGFKV